ncbi:5-methyltetrahydropteroyltriglutamate-homocysteine methyltransferase [Macroventuria anomochaeta]|uniref:5-methyltetrahydropteroyltriglutamate-homocysteine methyltransferase n=1 Tax=Macroventuria anomochaeta TaxID=301207 RepID=A0ACB6S2S3_9PLEO|nr:5-methyltetrahydropteroyltriglutamate-homocysteine methyltransferase [Macroventuria anomochaeta]KAF2628456.1 5-methyltetrahydropteroyltriglutamate-homocysteine methyltransferase [Macroventuria anomochaeta]
MSFALHRSPPFRAEHLGSLKRPQSLLDARYKDHKSEAELAPLEDRAIQDIVKTQLDLGFYGISDGEYRRHMFWGTFWPSLEGMKEIQNPPLDTFRTYVPDIAAFLESGHQPGESVYCIDKIKHTGESTYVSQVEYLKTLLPKGRWGDIKLTLAAPNWYHLRYVDGKAYPKDVYANDKGYFADVAKAYQVELDILYKAGLRNVQFDDPNLAYFCSEKMLIGWKEDTYNTISADDVFDLYIQLYNSCISQAPPDMHIGVHLCRGNFVNSRHFSEGGYDRIATKLFQHLNVHTYYLEYDTPRAGGFEPLAHLPKNKNVILGVVTSKFPELEDKEELKRRIYAAADVMAKGHGETREEALNRCGISPQCGFASHAEGNLIDIEGMKRKLRLVREVANEVWPGEA